MKVLLLLLPLVFTHCAAPPCEKLRAQCGPCQSAGAKLACEQTVQIGNQEACASALNVQAFTSSSLVCAAPATVVTDPIDLPDVIPQKDEPALLCPKEDQCRGKCVDRQIERKHCGVCDNACAAGSSCVSGQCTASTGCEQGLNDCNNDCVDLLRDRRNCGACGNECDTNAVCRSGQCATLGCSRGMTSCAGSCVDVQNDPLNCGACNNVCGPQEVCSNGACTVSCGQGVSKCGNKCVDLAHDPIHCGGCGISCGFGQVCSNGSCELTCGLGSTACGDQCVDTKVDPNNCGSCGAECWPDEVCNAGNCELSCGPGTQHCDFSCVDVGNDPSNCGACGNNCGAGEVCKQGSCDFVCGSGTAKCGSACVDLLNDSNNCGGCGQACTGGKVCANGSCTPPQCGATSTWCSTACVDLKSNTKNCGACGNTCGTNTVCSNGVCAACNSAVSDCDGDGWLASEGDCCDRVGTCSSEPDKVNPGAVEVLGNGVDDNCNGVTDLFDTLDTLPCDSALSSSSVSAGDYAKAMGICRTTTLTPATKQQKTWGLIEAKLVRADGSAFSGTASTQSSIRGGFGASILPMQGSSLVVLSSGIAADASQTNPGPNSGAPSGSNVSSNLLSVVNIDTCTGPLCVKDWLNAANPPLKASKALPATPNCTTGTGGTPANANDSVMLVLTLRAPTNARAFSFNSSFFSAEYPEFVCSDFSDQFITLVDTPTGVTQPIANPVDKNLMTYTAAGKQWPVGINVASGTDLFSLCRPNGGQSDSCWDSDVSAQSCQLGQSALAGTGFEQSAELCNVGGGTSWLTTVGNVNPGQIVQIRIALWDVGDMEYDSLALLDGFQWLQSAALPGTN